MHTHAHTDTKEKDHGLTTGSIRRKIVLFALPIFFSNLFQQLYNLADALIVGNAINEKALAAVSAGGSIIFLMTGFVHGLSIGSGVIIARHFGARSEDALKKSIHTSVFLGMIIGVILMIVSIFLTPAMLRLLGTPADVLPSSISYFRIYCIGLGALVVTNFCMSSLQSIGDSRTPMRFLMASVLTNIVLDVVFIIVFRWGVEGAAAASTIAMFLNAALALSKLYRLGKKDEPGGIVFKNLRFYPGMLKPIILQGVPSGLQNSVTSLSHLVIQSSINLFGSMAMAGCASYSRIEGFIFLPITSFAMALTTFISQNMGARFYDRVKKSMRFGVITASLLSEGLGVIMYIFAPYLVGLFSQAPEVIEIGTAQMRTISLFYFLLAYSHGCSGILRGLGRPLNAMIVFLIAWCAFRIAFVVIGIQLIHSIYVVFWAFPAAWTLSSVLFTIFVLRATGKDIPTVSSQGAA